MKVSLKLDEQQNLNPIIFKAKIPIAVFNLPVLSAVTATHHHHSAVAAAAADTLSLSLRTHFTAGPSLKLSYNAAAAVPAAATAAPLTVTFKSGISLSGSPTNSPLIISANFSFSPQNPNPNPSFLIQFKPKLGSFSFRKSISSVITNGGKKVNGEDSINLNGFVSLDRASIWKGLTVEAGAKGSILSGALVAADTELPVGRRVKVGLRWGVGVPSGHDKQLPYLRLNKIKVERVDDVDDNVGRKEGSDVESGEFEMLKGMCSWMGRELGDLRNENREMRRTLEEVKLNRSGRSGGFKKGEASVKETKKSGGLTDVESELQKAIKAASSA
ncbi:uncharacterized protein LOC143529563 [Bidens hawaiensis]|uniref:uncharacterized protein LOC143529563 n=1 Tax=Bidens hawaiensis TaxID=980011 RepID=UPI00404A6EBF